MHVEFHQARHQIRDYSRWLRCIGLILHPLTRKRLERSLDAFQAIVDAFYGLAPSTITPLGRVARPLPGFFSSPGRDDPVQVLSIPLPAAHTGL